MSTRSSAAAGSRRKTRRDARPPEMADGGSSTAVATGPLGALSHDELGVIFNGLADPVDPGVAVALLSTCKGLRTPLRPALREALRPMFKRVVELCLKVRVHWWELRTAESLGWHFNPTLTSDDLATLNMILRINGLPRLKTINLGWCGLSAGSIQVLCEGLGRGAAPSLEWLNLSDNQLGRAGTEAVAAALSRGAMPRLQKLVLNGNHIGDEGLAALAAPLRKLPALKDLELTACGFSDEGFASLVADIDTSHFRTLVRLLMHQNQLAAATCYKLTAAINSGALPALKELHFTERGTIGRDARLALADALAPRWGVTPEYVRSLEWAFT